MRDEISICHIIKHDFVVSPKKNIANLVGWMCILNLEGGGSNDNIGGPCILWAGMEAPAAPSSSDDDTIMTKSPQRLI